MDEEEVAAEAMEAAAEVEEEAEMEASAEADANGGSRRGAPLHALSNFKVLSRIIKKQSHHFLMAASKYGEAASKALGRQVDECM